MKLLITLTLCLCTLAACGSDPTTTPPAAIQPVYGYSENAPIHEEFTTMFEALDLPGTRHITGMVSFYNYPVVVQVLVAGEVRQQVEVTKPLTLDLTAGPGAFEIQAKSLNPTSYVKPCETFLKVEGAL